MLGILFVNAVFYKRVFKIIKNGKQIIDVFLKLFEAVSIYALIVMNTINIILMVNVSDVFCKKQQSKRKGYVLAHDKVTFLFKESFKIRLAFLPQITTYKFVPHVVIM